MDDDARVLAMEAASCEPDWDPDIASAEPVLQAHQLIIGCGVPCHDCRWDDVEPQLEAPVYCTGGYGMYKQW
ncbi:hypothetical protein COCOBI_09-5560 [Coccomyxa sp. Obi]|nr:hypothetical protein COCOBI_09-5560 [Coccomyxa sp. Obi]